jgi:hypothetical protein
MPVMCGVAHGAGDSCNTTSARLPVWFDHTGSRRRSFDVTDLSKKGIV